MNEQLLSSTYCDRPYTELHIEEDGSVTPCCVMPSNRFPMGHNIKEYLNGEPLKLLKDDLNSGTKSPNCEWCWSNEGNNLKTHRIKNPRKRVLQSIHIRLNNVCNFKCRMCNPSFSSTWAQENKKHNYFKYLDNTVVKDNFEHTSHYLFPLLEDQIKKGNLKLLSISGGEPLISDSHFKLLDFLISNKLTDLSLSYSTNLSNLDYKNIDLLELWSKFSNVSLEASIDGWGQHAEYSRTGLSIDTFKDNFVRAFKYIDAINCVVNIYSVWTLPYIEKFRKHGINIVYSPCYRPPHCNPQILFQEDKNKLKILYEPYPELTRIYNNFINTDLEIGCYVDSEFLSIDWMRRKMLSYNLLLDSYRDTNFLEVFPMYTKYES